jgi:imidazolonepropionase-like amidohydrolase
VSDLSRFYLCNWPNNDRCNSGTDTTTGLAGTAFGLSLHHELYLYVKRCGLTPLEALHSATSTTARRFKLEDRGRLAKGKRADLLMVKGDPTNDISCTLNITGVWRGGVAIEKVN